MTAALEFSHVDGWTTDDLDALPEGGRRRELIDGVLHMTPTPSQSHQTMAMLLGSRLYAECPAAFSVTQALEVRISKRRSLIPDVLVVTASAASRNPVYVEASEVVVAVEIVSPSSTSIDRILKPALYAEAGVPHYWRIESDAGVVVHTYRLDTAAGVYTSTGEHRELLAATDPWPISIPIAEFTPRTLR